MKIDKSTRHKTYKKALELLADADYVSSPVDTTKRYNRFACHAIANALNKNDFNYKNVDETTFPEILMFKTNDTSLWLSDFVRQDGVFTYADNRSGNELRQTVLCFCIEMSR